MRTIEKCTWQGGRSRQRHLVTLGNTWNKKLDSSGCCELMSPVLWEIKEWRTPRASPVSYP
eukprot:5516690-Pyramimonas_sp.AAC.2